MIGGRWGCGSRKQYRDFSEVKYIFGLGAVGRLAVRQIVAIVLYYYFFVCVLPWQGALPVWEKADGLHGWQPAELVGSTSDTPSCHADVISKPELCRRSSLRLVPRRTNVFCTTKKK